MIKEIEVLLNDAKEFVKQAPYLRLGQTLYNLADKRFQEYTRSINGNPDIDPFYKDENIERFLKGLKEWINESK